MRRRPLSLILFALAAACGSEQTAAPPLPMGKVPPTLTRRVRGRTLEEWLGRAQAPEAALRSEAPWALVELSSEPAVLLPVLERLIGDPSPDVRHAVLVALGRVPGELGMRLETALFEALTSRERGLALAAAGALLERGERSTPGLARVLAEGPEQQAREAARLLGELGPAALAAAPALARALGSAPIAVRLNAGRALERLGAAALPALGEALPAADAEGSLALLELIRAQRRRALVVLDPLLRALSSAEPDTARLAEEVLFVVGAPALEALGTLAATGTGASAAAARVAARIRETLPR